MAKATLPSRYECNQCKTVEILSDVKGCPACSTCMKDMTLVENVAFKVGDGVHYSFNGDSYPGTVRKVSKSGREVWISNDDHRGLATENNKHLHEGPIDSVFIPLEVDESQWRKFRLMNNKRKRNVFTDGAFNLWPGRVYSQNPSF